MNDRKIVKELKFHRYVWTNVEEKLAKKLLKIKLQLPLGGKQTVAEPNVPTCLRVFSFLRDSDVNI